MAYTYRNNASSTLAADLTDVGTSITVQTGDGALFGAPTSALPLLITLDDGAGTVEIVKCTNVTTDTLTVTRAQEGTTGVAWATGSTLEARLTAGHAAAFVAGTDGNVKAGSGANATGYLAVAIGSSAAATNSSGVALGPTAWATGNGAVSIGGSSNASGNSGIALGSNATASGPYSVAIGEYATARVEEQVVIPGVYAAQRAGTAAWSGDVYYSWSAPYQTLFGPEIDATATADGSVTLPTGMRFYPDEVGVIVTDASGNTQPTIRFGEGTGGSEATLLAAVATTGLDAVGERQRFKTLLHDNGVTALSFGVTVAATGVLKLRPYWRGLSVENEP